MLGEQNADKMVNFVTHSWIVMPFVNIIMAIHLILHWNIRRLCTIHTLDNFARQRVYRVKCIRTGLNIPNSLVTSVIQLILNAVQARHDLSCIMKKI